MIGHTVHLGREPVDDVTAALREQLARSLREAGFVHRLAPVSITTELHRRLVHLRDSGLLSACLYEEYEQSLVFSCPGVAHPRTLIVVATPSPAVKVRFHLEDGPLEAVIPPTYIHRADQERCLRILRSVLAPAGGAVALAHGPVKLLATHSGLAQYGRNNLAYVTGFGSYVRLDMYCTDVDLGAVRDEFKGSLRMSCCPPCRNCHHVCPTGCIPHDGTVIEAERCLTYLNEHEGEWPGWLDPVAHNSLVGCMHCHALCPANRCYVRKEPLVAEFDHSETDLIIQGLAVDKLPSALRQKLAALDLDDYATVLGRNIRALKRAEAERA